MAKPPRIDVSGVKQRRKRFAVAHDKGMRALRTRDYDALGDAIREERDLIEEQAALVRAVASPKRKRKPSTK